LEEYSFVVVIVIVVVVVVVVVVVIVTDLTEDPLLNVAWIVLNSHP
jgi:hypothetical protein